MNRRPILLDLFSGAGGAAMGYHRAGFDVVGVDIAEQPHYPFPFVQRDAMQVIEYIADRAEPWPGAPDFAAIHASPPCQAYSAYRRRGQGVGDGHPKLIEPVRELLKATGLPYVIENVPGAPLQKPVRCCGSAFGLDVRRHRLFEIPCRPLLISRPCRHELQTPRFPPASNRTNLRSTVEVGVYRIPLAVQQKAMGIDWMTLPELSQAIPPAYTEYIGAQLLGAITDAKRPGKTTSSVRGERL